MIAKVRTIIFLIIAYFINLLMNKFIKEYVGNLMFHLLK